MRFLVAHLQRVQIGNQMTAIAIGADDHQGAHAVENGALHLFAAQLDTLFAGGLPDLLGVDLGIGRPLPVERLCQLVIRRGRPVGPEPRRACGLFPDVAGIFGQFGKELRPFRIDRIGVAGIARVKLFDIFRVLTLQKAGGVELVVRWLVCHMRFRSLT